ncbi:MAG TPA: phosphate acetyltransferase [Ignavibacteria bacterium]|nr:phosphate acetyltransferase [Ignavibacteria bacterium]HMR41032.1 phosphate acetyltransferase [Ignavibacteria bacterium]
MIKISNIIRNNVTKKDPGTKNPVSGYADLNSGINDLNSHKRVIFPESCDKRIIAAVKVLLEEKICNVVLIQDKNNHKPGIKIRKGLTIVSVDSAKDFLEEYHGIKLKKDADRKLSVSEKELKDPLTFACMMLRNNQADGIIAGSIYSTSLVLRNAISLIGLKKNNKTVSSFFLLRFPKDHFLGNRVFAYADCGVIPVPTADQLSDIAIQTSGNFYKLTGLKPKVAFLSFSTKGSAKDESLNRVFEGMKITKKKKSDLLIDGELQFDAAFVPEVAKRKNPKGQIKGDANVFIFPDLNSGNIAYKITERIGGASATGPILQGLAKPVMDLSRGCSAEDIINMTKTILKY